jgi:hypothetical protein
MHLSPYAVRNKKNFKKNGKSKKALARFPPTNVLNNCIIRIRKKSRARVKIG